MIDYALYHGDEFIAIGSIRQLAKRQNVKIKTIQYYRYRSYAKRTNGKQNDPYMWQQVRYAERFLKLKV